MLNIMVILGYLGSLVYGLLFSSPAFGQGYSIYWCPKPPGRVTSIRENNSYFATESYLKRNSIDPVLSKCQNAFAAMQSAGFILDGWNYIGNDEKKIVLYHFPSLIYDQQNGVYKVWIRTIFPQPVIAQNGRNRFRVNAIKTRMFLACKSRQQAIGETVWEFNGNQVNYFGSKDASDIEPNSISEAVFNSLCNQVKSKDDTIHWNK